jgi:hypothetical protein
VSDLDCRATLTIDGRDNIHSTISSVKQKLLDIAAVQRETYTKNVEWNNDQGRRLEDEATLKQRYAREE